MARRSVAGFDDVPQGFIYYGASAGFALVFLFGLQAAIVGISTTDIIGISIGVGLWVILGTTFHVRKVRLRARAQMGRQGSAD